MTLPRLGAPFFCLAAALGVAVVALVLAAAAEQDQQDDDPAQIATAEAVIAIVTHKNTSEKKDAVRRRSFHGIHARKICACVSFRLLLPPLRSEFRSRRQ